MSVVENSTINSVQSMGEYFHCILDRLQGISSSDNERREMKTLLLVDATSTEQSLKFFLNDDRCVVLDGYKMHFDRTMKKKRLKLILEEARLTLVNAMINGKTIIFRLKDVCLDLLTCNDEHCKDLDPVVEPFPPFGSMSYFPACWHFLSGEALRREEWYSRMIHRKDFAKNETRLPCHSQFSVLFTTTIPFDDVRDRLFRESPRVGLPAIENFELLVMPELSM